MPHNASPPSVASSVYYMSSANIGISNFTFGSAGARSRGFGIT